MTVLIEHILPDMSMNTAHAHDPVRVSHITTPPATLAESAPQLFQDALTILQGPTSAAFASSRRLQVLLGERIHRLIPIRVQPNSNATEIGGIECAAAYQVAQSYANYAEKKSDSEPAFFTYTGQLQSEKPVFARTGTARLSS
jgi:hypothetical protein